MTHGLPLPGLPPPNAIDVWQLDVDPVLDLAARLSGLLSTEEQSRANRFIRENDAQRYRLYRSMLRVALGQYLECEPATVELTTRWRAKPCLAGNSPLHFNISHAGSMVLFAFTTVGEVGIDVEAVGRDLEAMELAAANFTPRETAMIAAASDKEERTRIFVTFWTRKEAVLKASGCGLYHPLNTLDVSTPALHEIALVGEDDSMARERWSLRDLDVAEGYAGAVAAPAGDWAIRRRMADENLLRGLYGAA